MPGYVLTGALAVALAGSLVPPLAARQEGSGSAIMPGRAVYEKACSRCHGSDGRSMEAPSLVPFGWNYSQALNIVRNGGPCGMPVFTDAELSDEELTQIVDYLKTLN